ncbi:MAG: colanic acid biosynthesis glycosyltransferase WcaI [Chitinophagaceae bacterium]|nr:MAG: colanic acid biosynthesis glycosyltransferase WcaI [Chitinophagaceae bacterium]
MKRILLIGGNYHPELTGVGRYNGEMMDWLASHGYECTVVTTYPYYPQWKTDPIYRKRSFWYSREKWGAVQVHRCPHYVPATPGGLKRMMLDLTFTVSAFFKILQLSFGPKRDIVMVVAPPFVPGFLGVLYKKLRGARLVYHVQDLQIEAARDLQMVRSKKMTSLLFSIERFILKRADQLSSISAGMLRKMKEKTGQDVILFPNWSDTTKFFPLQDRQQLKTIFGLKESDKIILYSGAIGEKQGLDIVLKVAQLLKEFAELKFIICGTGPYKKNLQAKAKEMELSNLLFFSLQPVEKLNQFLNMADVHLVIQKADASDLVMPSKLTNILAVGGLAVVTAVPGTSLFEEVHNHQMGILAESENAASFVEAVKRSINTDCSQLKTNAREYAENYLSIDKVMQRFTTGLHAMHDNKRIPPNVKTAS